MTGQNKGEAAPIFVKTIPPGYRDWKFVSVTHEEGTLNDIRVILGNDMAVMIAGDSALGDPNAGEKYFNGSGGCNKYHSLSGDLVGIAHRYDFPTLRSRLLRPRPAPTTEGVESGAGLAAQSKLLENYSHTDLQDVLGLRKDNYEKLLPVQPYLGCGDPEQFIEQYQSRLWMPTLEYR